MLDSLAPYLGLAGILLFSCLWTLRPKHGFKAPETKEFDPQIFKYFTKRDSLFVNRPELALLTILQTRLAPHYCIFLKVRLEDIIGVDHKGLPPKLVWSLRGRVKSRHVDFLITNRKGVPLMIIELDGASYNSKIAKRTDDLKNGLAKAVKLPLRRINAGEDFHNFVAKIKADLPPY